MRPAELKALSKSCMKSLKTEQFLLTMKSSLELHHSWVQNFATKQRKNSLACGFDVAFLPNVFRVVEKQLWAVFKAEKKLFNPEQVALTKIPRNEAKIYQKTDFLSSEGHLLASPGCRLTYASSFPLGPNDLRIGHLGQVCTLCTFCHQTLHARCLW